MMLQPEVTLPWKVILDIPDDGGVRRENQLAFDYTIGLVGTMTVTYLSVLAKLAKHKWYMMKAYDRQVCQV